MSARVSDARVRKRRAYRNAHDIRIGKNSVTAASRHSRWLCDGYNRWTGLSEGTTFAH